MCKFIWDISDKSNLSYYMVSDKKKKIYKIIDENQIKLVQIHGISQRWYDNELQEKLKLGYVLVNSLDEF